MKTTANDVYGIYVGSMSIAQVVKANAPFDTEIVSQGGSDLIVAPLAPLLMWPRQEYSERTKRRLRARRRWLQCFADGMAAQRAMFAAMPLRERIEEAMGR